MSLGSPMTPTKTSSKKKILYESTQKIMEKILDMINQNVQTALKKFQDTKNKEHEKTLKKNK
jgi:mevalonate kinase